MHLSMYNLEILQVIHTISFWFAGHAVAADPCFD